MRTPLAQRLFPIAVVLALASAGCSLLLNFDPEGQPCDNDGLCLDGYGCGEDKRCHKGIDAGPQDCAHTVCKPGERCSVLTNRCVPNTCQFRRCGVGSYCSDDAGIPTCPDLAKSALGHVCFDDAQCAAEGPNRVCYRGAVQINTYGGALRNGACVETCSPAPATGCLTAGATRKTFSLGADAGQVCLCLPDGILTPCANDDGCRDYGLVCTVYDHPAIGPATVCDSPATGAEVGEPCVLNTSLPDGGTFGTLCKNGLCVPRVLKVGEQGTCGELCDQHGGVSTCAGGKQCQPVEFSTVGVIRHVPMCIAQTTHCANCVPGGGTCGIDAPQCTTLLNEQRCLSACSADAGAFAQCPTGLACQPTDAGYRCAPAAGVCF